LLSPLRLTFARFFSPRASLILPPFPHPPRQIASLKSSAAQSAKEKAEIEAVLTSTASRLTLVQNDLRGENDALSAQV
jgi:hypothetical protein